MFNNYTLIRVPRTATSSILKALNKHFDHEPASKVKQRLGSGWDKTFKFSIVREPYDRFISMFARFDGDKDLNEFVAKKEFINNVFYLPQSYYLDTSIDYIGRFETLDNSWQYICKMIGTNVLLERVGKTKRGNFYLNANSKNIIYNFYEKDFKRFNYI